jgi:hypothetical protein
MLQETLQILFFGDLPTWIKVAEVFVVAPLNSVQFHRATSLRDAMRCLADGKLDAILFEFSHPPAKELLSALQLHSVFHSVPAVALLAFADSDLEGAALSAGAASCLAIDNLNAESLRDATIAAIKSKKSSGNGQISGQMELILDTARKEALAGSRIEVISHALTNLLCIISANADILEEQFDASQPAGRSLDQIKKATKTATELMRQLRTT